MPTACCVIGCKSRGNTQTGIQFFQLPLNKPKVLTQWLIVLDRRDWIPKPSSRICSLHFSPDDYVLRTNSNVPRLKPEAIPSVFPDLSETSSQEENTQSPPKKQPVEEVKKFKENKAKLRENTPKITTPLASDTPSQRPRRVSKLNPRMKDFILLDEIKKHKHSSYNSTPGRPPPSEKEKAAQELLSILEDSSSLSGDESLAHFSSKAAISSLAKTGVSVSIVPSNTSQKTNSPTKFSGSNVLKDKSTSFKSNSPLGNVTPKSINKQGKSCKKIMFTVDNKNSGKTIILDDSADEEEPELPVKSRKVATKSTGGRLAQRNFKGKVSDSTKYTLILPDGKGSLSIDKTKVFHENGDTNSASEKEDTESESSDETNIDDSANESTKSKSIKKSFPSAFRKTYFQVKEGEKIYYFSYADLNPVVDLTKKNKLFKSMPPSTSNSDDEKQSNGEPITPTEEDFHSGPAESSVDGSDEEVYNDEHIATPSPTLAISDNKSVPNKKVSKTTVQSSPKETEIKKKAIKSNPINENVHVDEVNINETSLHEASAISLEDDSTMKFLSDIGITPPVISKVSKNFKVTPPLKRKKRFKTVAEIVVRTDTTGQIPSVSIDKINNLLDFDGESPRKKSKRPKTSFIASITPDHNIAANMPAVSTVVAEDSLDKVAQNVIEVIKKVRILDKVKDTLAVVITSLAPVKEKETLIITKKNLATNEQQAHELEVAYSSVRNIDEKQGADENAPFISVVGLCNKDSSSKESLKCDINGEKESRILDSIQRITDKHSVDTLQGNKEVSPLADAIPQYSAGEVVRNNSEQRTNGSAELNSSFSEEVIAPLQHDHTYMTVVSPNEKSGGETESTGGIDQSKEVFSKLRLSESEISFRTKVSQKLRLLKENVKRKNEAINKLKDKIKFLEKTLREERRTKKRITKPRKGGDANSLYEHILDDSTLVKSREYNLNSGDIPLEFEDNGESEEEDRECSSPITYLCEPAIDVSEKPNPED